jgi:hypothetical protein
MQAIGQKKTSNTKHLKKKRVKKLKAEASGGK